MCEKEHWFKWLVKTGFGELSNKDHFTNFLAIGFAMTYLGLILTSYQVPERFETIVIMIISFYFGTKMKN